MGLGTSIYFIKLLDSFNLPYEDKLRENLKKFKIWNNMFLWLFCQQ